MAEQKALPDQLASIREKIAKLKIEEEAIREILINDPSARLGSDYIAVVRSSTTYRIKGKDLEKANPELFAKLAKESTSQQVLLTRRDGD